MKTQNERARECVNACIGIASPEGAISEALAILNELFEFVDDMDNGADEVAEYVMGTARPRIRALLGGVDMDLRRGVIPEITEKYILHLDGLPNADRAAAYRAMTREQLLGMAPHRERLGLGFDNELFVVIRERRGGG